MRAGLAPALPRATRALAPPPLRPRGATRAPAPPPPRVFAGGGGAAALDDDVYTPTVDISLARVSQGKRIGSGSYGDVFLGEVASEDGGEAQPVVLKRCKVGLNARRFFRAEAATWRRLRGNAGLAPFLGVAGADAYLVWRDVGLTTLEAVLARRDSRSRAEPLGLHALAEALDTETGAAALRALARRLLLVAAAVHAAAVVHRDIKPANVLISDDGGAVKLLDLGAAADLASGVNYDADEAIYDPTFGPPEQFLSFPEQAVGRGALPALLGWKLAEPDKFDAFSCGMVLLSAGVPYMRAGDRMRRVKAALANGEFTLQEWRDRLPGIAQGDFGLLDADDGAGWELLCGLLETTPAQRWGVPKALRHRFVQEPQA